MFGNIISNAEIVEMVDKRTLTIQPFSAQKLKLAHYRLQAGRLLRPQRTAGSMDTDLATVHEFRHNSPFYVFRPSEYLVVEVREIVILPPGIVGNFLPASALIELGFGLTAGKLDPGYGSLDGEEQKVLFGLKNQLDVPNEFDSRRGLAHIYFVNLTGLRTVSADFTPEERADFRDRDPRRWAKAADDGVHYPQAD